MIPFVYIGTGDDTEFTLFALRFIGNGTLGGEGDSESPLRRVYACNLVFCDKYFFFGLCEDPR